MVCFGLVSYLERNHISLDDDERRKWSIRKGNEGGKEIKKQRLLLPDREISGGEISVKTEQPAGHTHVKVGTRERGGRRKFMVKAISGHGKENLSPLVCPTRSSNLSISVRLTGTWRFACNLEVNYFRGESELRRKQGIRGSPAPSNLIKVSSSRINNLISSGINLLPTNRQRPWFETWSDGNRWM